ncbi:MAG: DUF3467 domain-containing protein [Patescibacteria group bacterium]
MENQNQQPQEIKITDNFAGGEYANGMQISYNKEEFLIYFFNIMPPAGRVCAKIITSPGHLKRMAAVLEDNLKKYESQFGSVSVAENPKDGIGFKV